MFSAKYKFVRMLTSYLAILVAATIVVERGGLRYIQCRVDINLPRYQEFERRKREPLDVLFVGPSYTNKAIHVRTLEQIFQENKRPIPPYYVMAPAASSYSSHLDLIDRYLVGPRCPKVLFLSATPRHLLDSDKENNYLRSYASARRVCRALPTVESLDEMTAALKGLLRPLMNLESAVVLQVYDPNSSRDRKRAETGKSDSREQVLIPPRPKRVWQRALREGKEMDYAKQRSDGRADGVQTTGLAVHNQKALEEIVDLCGQRGIHLVLWTEPLYINPAVMFPAKCLHEYTEYMTRLARLDHVDFHFFEKSDFKLTADDFIDPTHVGPSGASKVTRRLTEGILLPLLDELESRSTAKNVAAR